MSNIPFSLVNFNFLLSFNLESENKNAMSYFEIALVEFKDI